MQFARYVIMRGFINKHWLKIAGILSGAIGGYLYYQYAGCFTGTCAISSNPWRMTIYGAVMGYLLFDFFKKRNPRKDDQIK